MIREIKTGLLDYVMVIYLKSIGDLQDYFGRNVVEIELFNESRVVDLLEMIQECWGTKLPGYMWDSNLHRFRGPIYLISNSRILDNENSSLSDKQEITIMKALAGG